MRPIILESERRTDAERRKGGRKGGREEGREEGRKEGSLSRFSAHYVVVSRRKLAAIERRDSRHRRRDVIRYLRRAPQRRRQPKDSELTRLHNINGGLPNPAESFYHGCALQLGSHRGGQVRADSDFPEFDHCCEHRLSGICRENHGHCGEEEPI